jgi:hypothetical protein
MKMNMTLENRLLERGLPNLLGNASAETWPMRRKELLAVLSREVYGAAPEFGVELHSFVEAKDEAAHGGKATREWVRLSFITPGGMYSFPFQLLLPKTKDPAPAFVHIAFQQKAQGALRPAGLDEYMPVEEILDAGYAVANLYYEDVTSDTPERDGLARACPHGRADGWGKIGMWAFAASRVLDYLLARAEIDAARVAVSGWSRLGKTALWCGAQDERFSMVISTESGCGGAALHRGKAGESPRDITSRFGYWFCRNYAGHAQNGAEAPFDQHFLLACIAPRALFIGSAHEDEWADPVSEFLGAAAASPAYSLLGTKGLIAPDAHPRPGQAFLDGNIGYLLREGSHGMSREDWLSHMRFRQMRQA